MTQERIMFHYSLLGDSSVEGSFYFLRGVGGAVGGGLNINVDINKKERWIFLPTFNTLRLDCSRLGEDNPV